MPNINAIIPVLEKVKNIRIKEIPIKYNGALVNIAKEKIQIEEKDDQLGFALIKTFLNKECPKTLLFS